jgi:hypothetical protein
LDVLPSASTPRRNSISGSRRSVKQPISKDLKMPEPNRTKDFWKRVKFDGPEFRDGSLCWLWLGTIDKSQGYGLFYLAGKRHGAHRFSYELCKGLIKKGMILDHLCRNRACVNPLHLEEVTNQENILRGVSFAAKNKRKTQCVHGHELTGENVIWYWRKFGKTMRQCRECRACRRINHRRLNDRLMAARHAKRERIANLQAAVGKE